MLTKAELIDFTAEMAKNEPADRNDVDHETNVHLYHLWVAQHRRAFAHAKDVDLDKDYWYNLVESQIERHIIEEIDLDLSLSLPNTEENRHHYRELYDQDVNRWADRIIETAKEY